MERCKLCQKYDKDIVMGKYGYCTSCEQELRTDISTLKQKLTSLDEFSQAYLTHSEKETAFAELEQIYCALSKYKQMHIPFFTSDIDSLRNKIFLSLSKDYDHSVKTSVKTKESAVMLLKSYHLEMAAIAVLIVGLLAGIALGVTFHVTVQEELFEGYFHAVERFNLYLAVAVMVPSVITALMLWFCSAVLFHLEKNRNFNRRTIELLETIVQQTSSKQPAEVSTPE